MEAIFFKSDLLKHKKSLKIVKLDKKIAQNASLTVTVSDKLSVVGVGFQLDLECRAQEWGTIIVRYLTWLRLIDTLRFIQDEEIKLSAENGKIKLGKIEIADSNIRVTRRDKIPLEIPINATPLEILIFLSPHGLERVKAAGLWNTVLEIIKEIPFNDTPFNIIDLLSLHGLENVKGTELWKTGLEIFKRIRKDLFQGYGPLQKYGVLPIDLVKILEQRLGLKESDHELFVQLLREAESSKD